MSDLGRFLRFYIFLVAILAFTGVVFSLPHVVNQPSDAIVILGIAVVIAVLDAFPVTPVGEGIELTISDTIKFASLLLYPVPVAVIGIFVGTALGEARIKREWFKKIFNIAEMTLTWLVVGWLFRLVYDPGTDYFGSLQNILALILAGLAAFTINSVFVSLVISFFAHLPFTYVWLKSYRLIIWPSLGMLSLGVFLAVLWQYDPLMIVLAIMPVFVVRNSYQLANQLQQQTKDALLALMQVIDERDQHTFDHSRNVSKSSRAMAEALKLPQEEIETIASAALLHDLGKVGMADGILFSPKLLNPEERKSAQRHAEIGAMLLSKFPLFEKGAILVRYHHERYDGNGYPDGLKGEAIPIGARIISVADAYQAMTEERPYRSAFTHDMAAKQIVAGSGSQFDPKVVEKFLELYPVSMPGDTPPPSIPAKVKENV
ncbi:MAG TPA: HD-GYP domain-containing protein [Anaerolineae bacterium]